MRLLTCLLFAATLAAQNRSTPLVILPSADDSLSGQLRLREKRANGSNYAGFAAPAALGANLIWILPSADGSTAECLMTDGAGVLYFDSCAGGGNVTGPAAGTGGELNTVDAAGTTLSRSALTGVLKAASGVPSVVTGTASNCVKVDGSSGACGTGGGASAIADLTDFKMTRGDATSLLIGAGVVQIGLKRFPIVADDCTVSGATTETVFLYNLNGDFKIGSNTAILSCTSWSEDTGITEFPAGSTPLGTWAVVGGVLAATGTDSRAIAGGESYTASTGVTFTPNGTTGRTAVAIDTATTPQFSSGTSDATGSCTLGQRYIRTDTKREWVCSDASNTWVSTTGGTRAIGCAVGDPAGSALATGVLCYIVAPLACTITSWDILIDAAASTAVRFWRVATGGTALPTVSNTINSGDIATTTAVVHSTTLTNFTSTAIAQFDRIAINLESGTPKYIYAGVNCDR